MNSSVASTAYEIELAAARFQPSDADVIGQLLIAARQVVAVAEDLGRNRDQIHRLPCFRASVRSQIDEIAADLTALGESVADGGITR